MNDFQEKGADVVPLKENFDTTTPQGKLMMTVFQALLDQAICLYDSKEYSLKEIRDIIGIGTTTLYPLPKT